MDTGADCFCDRLQAVELVTADGQLLRASADENPELFWGLRGGGGNFGIATAFEVNLHPGGTVLGGAVFYEATEAERILREYTCLAAAAPDELSTEVLFMLAPPAPFIPPDKQGTPVVVIMVCYIGDISEGERVVAPLRQLATPIADLIAPMPYPEIFALTAVGEIPGFQHHSRSQFFETFSDEMIHAFFTPKTMSTQFNQNNVAIVGQSENLDWFDTMPGEQMAIRVDSKDVDGAFTIIEVNVPPFVGPPLHYHKDREEIFEILEGRFRFHSEGKEFEVGPGTSVVVPRNTVHGWVNLGPGRARLLFTFVPGGIDEFFPQIGQTPPEGWTELARQHDTWIVGAPLSV